MNQNLEFLSSDVHFVLQEDPATLARLAKQVVFC